MTVLVIDNYDSFTYNLVQYIGELNQEVTVYRNDAIDIEGINKLKPSHIVISPGPGRPQDGGISMELIKYFTGKLPILGVCLGHQCIGEVFGGKIINAPQLMHGKTSEIYHEKESIFGGKEEIETPFIATRYHSLTIDPDSLKNTPLTITAKTKDGTIMGIEHKDHKNLVGVQFHPESILTKVGHKLLKNFLDLR